MGSPCEKRERVKEGVETHHWGLSSQTGKKVEILSSSPTFTSSSCPFFLFLTSSTGDTWSWREDVVQLGRVEAFTKKKKMEKLRGSPTFFLVKGERIVRFVLTTQLREIKRFPDFHPAHPKRTEQAGCCGRSLPLPSPMAVVWPAAMRRTPATPLLPHTVGPSCSSETQLQHLLPPHHDHPFRLRRAGGEDARGDSGGERRPRSATRARAGGEEAQAGGESGHEPGPARDGGDGWRDGGAAEAATRESRRRRRGRGEAAAAAREGIGEERRTRLDRGGEKRDWLGFHRALLVLFDITERA